MTDTKRKYCFDIDGTLCTNTHGRYEEAEPYPEVIAKVNKLFEAGHRIILFTARGSTTGKNWSELTKNQMSLWGVKYHQLMFGKPEADIFVDDKGISAADFMKGQ